MEATSRNNLIAMVKAAVGNPKTMVSLTAAGNLITIATEDGNLALVVLFRTALTAVK